MAKDEHLQEFLKLLRQELNKDKPPRNPRFDDMMARRNIPPSMAIQRLSRFNRKSREEDTWISMAATAFEQWERENYPETPIP